MIIISKLYTKVCGNEHDDGGREGQTGEALSMCDDDYDDEHEHDDDEHDDEDDEHDHEDDEHEMDDGDEHEHEDEESSSLAYRTKHHPCSGLFLGIFISS